MGEAVGKRGRALSTAGFVPARVDVVDVAAAIPAIPASLSPGGSAYARAASYVRWGDEIVGVAWTEIPDGGVDPETHAESIWSQLGAAMRTHAADRGVTLGDSLGAAGLGHAHPEAATETTQPHITAVIATRDRPELLDRCLQSLLALDYPTFDVLVVDNAPSSDATKRLIADRYGDHHLVRRIQEDRPGLAAAHNRALAEATGEIVAFTDDDVVADRQWLNAIAAAFASTDDVACVTGMIVPLQLDTQAQWWLEEYAGFSKGFERKAFNLGRHRPDDRLFPYAAGKLGSGANMAFRTHVLRGMGGFDPALGAGSGAYGGDDLAAFFEVVMHGHTLVYEPGAIVHHQHPATEYVLRRQLFGYGAGLTAYLTHTIVEQPKRALALIARVPQAVWYCFSRRSDRNRRRPVDFPFHLRIREFAGMVVGPVAYVRSRFRHRADLDDSIPSGRSG